MNKKKMSDPMMDEIHKIRERHYLRTRNLSIKDRIQDIEDSARKFITSCGYKLVPTDHGTEKLVKA